jgi:arylsulfatase A-like enzyme
MDDGQAKYASMCESCDASLGALMDWLEAKGVADNTVIILYADNGGHSIDARKGGVPHTQNAPLREGKGSCYEGGIREPLLVYVPGKTIGGMRINTPVGPEDFFPTILEMAGVESYSTKQKVDGQSFLKLIAEGSKFASSALKRGELPTQKDANRLVIPASISGMDPMRPIISHMPHQWRIEDQPDIDFMSSVRSGDWKLIYRMHNIMGMEFIRTGASKAYAAAPGEAVSCGVFELYNLADDISESHDLAASEPDKVAALAKMLGGRLREWDANMPVVRSTGRRVPWPDELL